MTNYNRSPATFEVLKKSLLSIFQVKAISELFWRKVEADANLLEMNRISIENPKNTLDLSYNIMARS